MAMTAMKPLPRAMLIDMDDTILSAYGCPEIAWNTIATEFAAKLAPMPPEQVAAAVLMFARNFWANAEAAWRSKLGVMADQAGPLHPLADRTPAPQDIKGATRSG